MPKPVKKTGSRQMFEAVFEEQTRRFSAFEILGLSTAVPSPSPSGPSQSGPGEWLQAPQVTKVPEADSDHSRESRKTAEGEELRPDRSVQVLRTDRSTSELRPDGEVEEQRTDGHTEALRTHSKVKALRPDRQVQGHVQYGLTEGHTVDAKSLGTTVWPSLGQTQAPSLGQTLVPKGKSELGHDRLALAPSQPAHSSGTVLLAPLQWNVWLTLQEVEQSGRLTSYRQIAKALNASLDGIKKAVRVIQQEGGIAAKEVVRTPGEQGFRIHLNRNIAFRSGTLNEAKAILKRGLSLGHTPDRRVQALGPDGLRMYVCIKNTNIQQTDIIRLLRISPSEWKLREQTLVQVADSFPEMTAIEFRLSLLYLVEQAKNAKEPIRNPNAWVKAAFEKNNGPLVTEREIEARFDQHPSKRPPEQSRAAEEGDNSKDFELLRRYLACTQDERAEIDRLAEEKASPLLKVIAEDKRPAVLEEARLEAVREFVSKKT